jgi:hypothetical protein
LPAPIERRYRKSARAQIAYNLEILFDEFGTALQYDHRTLASRRRGPTGETQVDPIRSFDRAGHHIVWHRIGWYGDEFHKAGKVSGARRLGAYSRVASALNPNPGFHKKLSYINAL